MTSTQQGAQPIVVRVLETPAQETTVGDVLIGSIGLTGVLVVIALVLGALLGAILIGIKRLRVRLNLEPVPDSEALKISPFP
jgi:hypothetical protein